MRAGPFEGSRPANVMVALETWVGRKTSLVRAAVVSIVLGSAGVTGCAGIAEGVTRGLTQRGDDTGPLPCEITGPAFDGVEDRLSRYETILTAGTGGTSDIKVLLVHGIGTHAPGWSARLQRNLSAALGLTVTSRVPKQIRLTSPLFPGEPIGELTVRRFFNEARTREMFLYELTWSEITTPKKETLAFDTSGAARRNRAALNHTLTVFLNDRLADPMAYLGSSGPRILASVSQANCWMASGDWEDLPDGLPVVCDFSTDTDVENFRGDEFVYITHSLGSRIAIDAFQRRESGIDATLKTDLSAKERRQVLALREEIQKKRVRVYMLANQLPLLDIAKGPPEITGG